MRLSPYDFEQYLTNGTLTAAPPDTRQFGRAREIFDEEVGKSFSLDLSDMSRDIWSILPQPGDMVAEVRTRRFRTLTYARAQGEAEDVTFFSRERKRNIAIYASPQKLASRGAFYDEDDLARVRRPRLRHRHRRRARPRVADRPRRAAAARQGLRARRAHAHAGRHLHDFVDHQQGARPAALPARPQPERRGRQPAGAAVARLRADPHGASTRARIERQSIDSESVGAGPTVAAARRDGDRVGRAQLAAQQPRELVSAAGRDRLRGGRRCASRCRWSTPWRPSACCTALEPIAAAGTPGGRAGSHLPDLAPGALPRRGGQPAWAGSTRRRWPSTSSCRRRRRRRARSPWRSCWRRQAAAGRRPQHRRTDGDGQPPTGESRPRRPGDDRRHPALLRLADGRCAVPGRSRLRCWRATCPAATARPTSP